MTTVLKTIKNAITNRKHLTNQLVITPKIKVYLNNPVLNQTRESHWPAWGVEGQRMLLLPVMRFETT